MLDISFGALPVFEAAASQAVVLVCGAGFAEDATFSKLDSASGGAMGRAVALKGFKGDAGQVLSLLAPAAGVSQAVLVGASGKDGAQAVAVENAAGSGVKVLDGVEAGVLALTSDLSGFAAEAALGARLASYRFDAYQTKKKPEVQLKSLTVVASDVDVAQGRWAALDAVSQGVFLTRDLVSEPANVLSPAEFAERIQNLASLGLEVEVLDEADMKELGFGALLGVAQGSANAPKTVIVHHRGGAEDEAPLAFVGKGVTFDSGGISIKPAAGMDEMKTDMGGAATVIGLMSVLARRKAPVNAIGVVGLVENMVSDRAQRPGDIVESYSGQTIEVLNTDAEGRLVLADVLAYTNDRFEPKLMVDLATLTGAIVVSLGTEHAGLFSNDDGLASALREAGQDVGEGVWRMPMGEAYNRLIDSDIADVKNIGGRPGGAITAAEFLKRFVGDAVWAHLDIAGVAFKTVASPTAPKGATGFGVRLLDRFVQSREGAV